MGGYPSPLRSLGISDCCATFLTAYSKIQISKSLTEFDVALSSQNLDSIVLISKILRNKYLALDHILWSRLSAWGNDRMFGLWKARAHVTRFVCGKVELYSSRKEAVMETILVWAVVVLVARSVRHLRTEPRRRARSGLCAACAFVHMQYGATGRNTVFCTFGGGVREVKLDVLYCTDYRNRNAPPRLVRVGFVPETRCAEVEAS